MTPKQLEGPPGDGVEYGTLSGAPTKARKVVKF